jgi:hypothetical protein
LLLDKYKDPAAALLGALFLARFAPTSLPGPWLRNLVKTLPDVGDTSLLLAWSRATKGDEDYNWKESIADQLRTATRSRRVLFARTRSMLAQLSRLYGPYPRSRQLSVSTPRHTRTGDYLDFAAEAGGLAAFWGTAPYRPGYESTSRSTLSDGIAVPFRGGSFERIDIQGTKSFRLQYRSY